MQYCTMCLAGFHSSCQEISCDCNHLSLPTGNDPSPTLDEEEQEHEQEEQPKRSTSRNTSARSGKRDATLKDQQSTGRKRAARLYPLNRESPCEWQGKAECGGGLSPILGCSLGKQEARHHGPDKSVSNNEEGNVHRICHACHNRWHAANNAEYDWNSTTVKPHNPRPQTEKEQGEAMIIHMTYSVKKNRRIKD